MRVSHLGADVDNVQRRELALFFMSYYYYNYYYYCFHQIMIDPLTVSSVEASIMTLHRHAYVH